MRPDSGCRSPTGRCWSRPRRLTVPFDGLVATSTSGNPTPVPPAQSMKMGVDELCGTLDLHVVARGRDGEGASGRERRNREGDRPNQGNGQSTG